MSIEANKAAVRGWFEAVNRGDEAAILESTAEDFVFLTMAVEPEWLQYKWDRVQFSKVPSNMSTVLTAPIQLKIVAITAEDDRVAVEAETDSQLLNGRRYNNAYHFVFKLRGGKFTEVREYSCSHLAQNCFGAVTPDDPAGATMAEA